MLKEIDIYGWDGLELYIMIGLINQGNTFIRGEKGSGKTYAIKRLAKALDDPFVKIDGHSAQEEDFIGYQLPPKGEDTGEPRYMQYVYSRNTLAFAKAVLIDEANRIPRHFQNRFLSLLDYRKVEGFQLPTEYLYGAGNPSTYRGVEVMDEALADRWWLIVDVPRFRDMAEDDRAKIMTSLAGKLDSAEVAAPIKEEFATFIGQLRDRYRKIVEGPDLAAIVRYVGKVTGNLDKSYSGSGPVCDGRRAAIITSNLAAAKAWCAVRRISFDGVARNVVAASFIFELHGGASYAPVALDAAHRLAVEELRSPEDQFSANFSAAPTLTAKAVTLLHDLSKLDQDAASGALATLIDMGEANPSDGILYNIFSVGLIHLAMAGKIDPAAFRYVDFEKVENRAYEILTSSMDFDVPIAVEDLPSIMVMLEGGNKVKALASHLVLWMSRDAKYASLIMADGLLNAINNAENHLRNYLAL